MRSNGKNFFGVASVYDRVVYLSANVSNFQMVTQQEMVYAL